MRKIIALESRLKECRNVITLGVKPNFFDYSPEAVQMIRQAERIYYPTAFYADLLDAAGTKTFPSYHTYKFTQDKIKQTAMFNLMGIPHPETRVYYGRRQQEKIRDHFSFPFIAKVPRGSAMGRGVFRIDNGQALNHYLANTQPAYIQQYLPIDRDMRVVIIGGKMVHAYWRIAPPHDFKSNVSAGGLVSLAPVDDHALDLALEVADKCQWDDVGIDICRYGGRYYVLEANMKYGKEGFRKAGIDYVTMMEEMIKNGTI